MRPEKLDEWGEDEEIESRTAKYRPP